jgi:tetratricopeptide (TPR) repeat protein/predicted Ser/Thr protein kinase
MTDVDGSLALRLRDAVRGDLERRFGDLCVSRGLLSEADLRRGLEEQERLRKAGEDASLVAALGRLGLVDGGPLWGLVDEVLAAPSEEPPPGRRLGRYELIREVGKGGTGTVYKAYDTQLRRVVAVKTIRPDLAEHTELVQSLVREARTLAGLSHKNIVRVYDAGEIDGTPFLSMEFVDGQPFVGRSTPSSVGLLRKVADALAHAHAQGIVHCDLKPGNILVDRDGEPRVIDFGLARLRRDKQGGRTVPEGTPAYMAPEQVRREPGAVGPLADVYALGVCLYEALTGARPFDGDSASRIFDRILAREFVPPRARRPEISRDLERICLRAMDADPKRRQAGAAELARELERATAARPRAWKGWVAGAVAVAAAALAVGAVAVQRDRQAARRLDARIRPLELMIHETRPFFYIKDADVPGRLERVRASLRELEQLAVADHGDLWRAIGAARYFTGDLIRAEEALLRAPSDGATNYYLGRIYLDRAIVELLTPPGRPDAERRERSRAWNEKAEARLGRASTWEGAPELDRRVAEAGLAFAKGDAAGAARLCREGLEKFAGKLGVEEFSRLLGVLSPPEERLIHLTRALEFRPHYPWARLQRGSQWLLDGRPDLAIEEFDLALSLYPQFVYALNDRGVARIARGEFDAAIADLDEAVRLDPRSGLARANRALARAGKRDLKGAIDDETEAIALYPFPAAMVFNRGVHRLAAGDVDGAMADAEHGLRLEPGAARGHTLRGSARVARQEWPEAVAAFEQALALDATHAEAMAGRGVARLTLGDRAAARRDFDESLRLRPALVLALFNRGTMKAEDGDLEGAVEDLTRAVTHDPTHLAALVSRGIALESQGEFEAAIQDYDAAIRLDPGSYDALFNRGLARLEQGKPAEAAADLAKALRLAPAAWNSRSVAESSLAEARKKSSSE